jgi:hypothetical protein
LRSPGKANPAAADAAVAVSQERERRKDYSRRPVPKDMLVPEIY